MVPVLLDAEPSRDPEQLAAQMAKRLEGMPREKLAKMVKQIFAVDEPREYARPRREVRLVRFPFMLSVPERPNEASMSDTDLRLRACLEVAAEYVVIDCAADLLTLAQARERADGFASWEITDRDGALVDWTPQKKEAA